MLTEEKEFYMWPSELQHLQTAKDMVLNVQQRNTSVMSAKPNIVRQNNAL